MKTEEVLKRYAAGERNFQGVNLRGQSFKGQNLERADFSEADIRSTNFTGANLREANFTGAKCGLQKRWAIFLIFNSCVLAMISGLASIMTIYFTSIVFFPDNIANQVSGLSGLIVFPLFLIYILCKGIKSEIVLTSVAGALISFTLIVGVSVFSIIGGSVIGVIAFMTIVAVAAVLGSSTIVIGAGAVARVTAEITISKTGNIPIVLSGLVLVIVADLLASELNSQGVYERFIRGEKLQSGKIFTLSFIIVLALTLVSIYVSRSALKKDRKNVLVYSIATFIAAIKGTSFNNANLTDANFSSTKLKSTDFRKANLTLVRWYGAKMLDRVRPGDTYLKNTQLRQWLIGEGKDKNFDRQDLRGINLRGADLTDASFIKADLSGANLQDTDLSRAKLVQTQLDNTDFTGATLTEACIEDWGINSQTNLKDVICDYAFLKDKERIPYDNNRKFQSGEFSKYVEKALNTVDLIFTDGIDWNAFLTSFKNLQDKYGTNNVGIQAIEKKPSGAFVIRVEVPPEINKAEIEKNIQDKYKLELAAQEKKYKKYLKAKDKDISYHKKQNTELIKIIELQAKQPINIAVNNENKNTMSNITQNHSGSGDNVARDKNTTNNYNSQDLPQAAAEIQQLLEQLSKTHPTNTTKEKTIVVAEAVDTIETNPQLKSKVINALKAGGTEAFKEAIDHPLVNILLSAIEGWRNEE